MERINTVIIGAGQAGLAASYYLTQQDREHLLLEKDRLGEAWRSGKWDSFTLVTPNWTLQLPGFPYESNDPDGFLHREEVVEYLYNYADAFDPPVRTGVEVTAVRKGNGKADFLLKTKEGQIAADNVIVATGTFQRPHIPRVRSGLSDDLHQLHSSEYRRPGQLSPGAVLIVGSGQSGCQIADELNEHGRRVFLATGNATRLPRTYRGKDSFWWAEQLGIFEHTVEDLPSPGARFNANPQVSGKNGGKSLDLHRLSAAGVTLLGHLEGADGTRAFFADDLQEHLSAADKFAAEFKRGVDQYIEKKGMDLPEASKQEPRDGYGTEAVSRLNLEKASITSVIWATGYDFDYSWIDFPVYDDAGYPLQERGVTEQPGLYFLGLHFLHNRKSGLLLGVGDDAKNVVDHITDPTSQ